ncbi:hypothetical protein ACTXT7_017633 [Hymenolepis weldensis]
METTSTRIKKSIQEMIDSHVQADPTEVPTLIACARSFHQQRYSSGLRVSANAYADVKTLQTIVKPPWIDSVANERRPL